MHKPICCSAFSDAEDNATAFWRWTRAAALLTMTIHEGNLFNLLDARGVISVTERAAYGRVRALARML